jgi:hypothetical protein
MIQVWMIRKLILELEIKLIELQNPEGENPKDAYLRGYLEGVMDRVEITIGQLKELIPNEADNSRNATKP